MTTFATLDAISIATPDGTRLFSNLSLSIGTERIGLVGRNGAGKSSLLRVVAGKTRPAEGAVLRTGTVGILAQDWPDHISVAEALGVADGLALVQRILAGQVSGDDLDAVDWTLEERVDGALQQVGLPAIALDRTVATLSGGQRTRVGVARILVEDPDLLLLDEPSNNLDAAGRSLIAGLIRGWRGGVVVASHDRRLLEDMDRIVELTPIGVRIVGGGWSTFAALRDAERARAAGELARSLHHLRDATRAAQQQREAKERRDKVGRAAAAKGSEPRILLGARAARAEESGGRARRIALGEVEDATARAEAARGKVEVLTPLAMELPPSGLPAGRAVLVLEAVTVAVGDRLLGPWTFDVRGPERIRVSGPNGAGKTSLLRCAAGIVAPAGGTAWRAEGRVAYLDQHVRLLDPGTSILDNLRRLTPELDEREAHAACARLAFRNHDAERLVGTLSGGEKLRAGLACTLCGERPPWLLVLDEPTNHLDIEAIEILEKALCRFDGALLVVSHDEAFLEAVGIDREILVDAEPT